MSIRRQREQDRSGPQGNQVKAYALAPHGIPRPSAHVGVLGRFDGKEPPGRMNGRGHFPPTGERQCRTVESGRAIGRRGEGGENGSV